MPREDRLFDLAWEWSWYARQMCPAPPERHVFVERQIAILSEAVFERSLSPVQMERLRRNLCTPSQLWQVGFPDRRPAPGSERTPLYHYLSSPSVFDRGHEAVLVDTTREAEALTVLQSSLRRESGPGASPSAWRAESPCAIRV